MTSPLTSPLITMGLQLLGLAFEMAGVVLMANHFAGIVRTRSVPWLLISALLGGDTAKGAARLYKINQENPLKVFRGLALIGIGFLAQFSGVLLALIGALAATSSGQPPIN